MHAGALPPGQREVLVMPRFGLTTFASRFPRLVDRVVLTVEGDVATSIDAGPLLASLPRVEQVSDFHCVTTWTKRGVRWGGVRFGDFYRQIVVERCAAKPEAGLVVLRGQDGARTSLPLEDLLAPDVLLADRQDGQPLEIAHGAPLRVVAPSHYGYKSVKHLHRIEFLVDASAYRPMGWRFMQHPRGRVLLEERGQGMPGCVLRYLYRPLIRPTANLFERETRRRLQSGPS